MTPPPTPGRQYVVREWDGEMYVVRVLKAGHVCVLFEYGDGLRHSVPTDYFGLVLKAQLVAQA